MALFAEFAQVTLVFIAAVAVVTWILLMRSHRYFARQQQQDEPASSRWTTKSPAEEPRHHLDAPQAAARWEVQMHDTARELSAQLDSKMSALQALIADADQAAARLEAALARSSGTAPEPAQPAARPGNQAESLQPPAADDSTVTTVSWSDAAGDRSAQDRRREEIYTLADYGFTPAEIARRVGSPIGEVELILGLRGKK